MNWAPSGIWTAGFVLLCIGGRDFLFSMPRPPAPWPDILLRFFSFSHHSKPWPSMMVIREQIPEWRKLPRWKELRRKKLLDLGGGGLQTTKQWHIESGFSSITFPRSWKLGCGDVWGFPWSGVKLFASSFFKFCLFMLDDSYTLGSRSKNSFGLNHEDYWSFESLCLSRGKRRAEFATN